MDDGLLKRAMNRSVAEGALATVMGTLTGGIFLTGFALELGANRLQIGILAALPALANLAQLVGAYLIERRKECKRLCMLTSVTSRLLWLPIMLIALLVSRCQVDLVWCTIAVFGISGLFAAIGGVAWLVWIKELIPQPQQVAFLGRRHLSNTALSLVIGTVAAFGVDYSRSHGSVDIGFASVFGIAASCGLMGLLILNRIPAPPQIASHGGSFSQLLKRPLRDPDFRSLVTFYGIWNLGVHLAQPFLAVYMLQKIGLSFSYVGALAMLSSILGLLTSNFWTRLCVEFGTKPVILLATLADMLIMVMWLFVTPQFHGILILLHCAGIFSAPLAMGPNNLLLRVAPSGNGAFYMAVFNSVIGAVTAVAAIGGGLLATLLENCSFSFAGLELGALRLIFVISALIRLASVPFLARLTEPRAKPVAQLWRVVPGVRRRLVSPAAAKMSSATVGAQEVRAA